MWWYLQYPLSVPSSHHFQIKVSRQLQNKNTREEDIFKSSNTLKSPLSSLFHVCEPCSVSSWSVWILHSDSRLSHPRAASDVGGLRVEMVADFLASCHPDVHVQTELIRRRIVNQVLWQRLEHHHGGLGEDRNIRNVTVWQETITHYDTNKLTIG